MEIIITRNDYSFNSIQRYSTDSYLGLWTKETEECEQAIEKAVARAFENKYRVRKGTPNIYLYALDSKKGDMPLKEFGIKQGFYEWYGGIRNLRNRSEEYSIDIYLKEER